MAKRTIRRFTRFERRKAEDCLHESLDLPRIAIAERCPRCWVFVTADGRTFELASQAVAVRTARAMCMD